MFNGAAYVFICLMFGISGGLVGRAKGSSFFIWFMVAAIIPFLGLLAAFLFRAEKDEPEAPCPRCGKTVKLHQAMCTRCGTELAYHAPGDQIPAVAASAPGPRTPW